MRHLTRLEVRLLESEGKIGSLDDPITKYIKALDGPESGGAFREATIRQLLDMVSVV